MRGFSAQGMTTLTARTYAGTQMHIKLSETRIMLGVALAPHFSFRGSTCPRQTLGAVQSHAMATCYPHVHASMEHLHKATTWPGWDCTCPRQTLGAVQSHAMATCYPHCHASVEHLHKATTWPRWYCIIADAIKSLHWGLNPGPLVYRTDALPLSYKGCWVASAPKVSRP